MIRACACHDWRPVTVEDFELFLKSCPDYTRFAWASGASYSFRHNGFDFAEVKVVEGKEIVLIDPKLLSYA